MPTRSSLNKAGKRTGMEPEGILALLIARHAESSFYDHARPQRMYLHKNRRINLTETQSSDSNSSRPSSSVITSEDSKTDQELLRKLKDSFKEFRNSLDHNKTPAAIRKSMKDYRCYQVMIAALNAADPGLNAHYCDGSNELDRLLRKISAEPAAATYRVLLKAGNALKSTGAHHVALEVRKGVDGVEILGLDSAGYGAKEFDTRNRELIRTVKKFAGVRGTLIPLGVQQTFLDCAIHAIYLLLQARKHEGEIAVPLAEAGADRFIYGDKEDFGLHADFFGLMDDPQHWAYIAKWHPELAEQELTGCDETVTERIERNSKTVTFKPTVAHHLSALSMGGVAEKNEVTYANSAELFRADLYRLTIDWVEKTPKKTVRDDMERIRPVKPGYEFLKRFPLAKAKEPSSPEDRYSLYRRENMTIDFDPEASMSSEHTVDETDGNELNVHTDPEESDGASSVSVSQEIRDTYSSYLAAEWASFGDMNDASESAPGVAHIDRDSVQSRKADETETGGHRAVAGETTSASEPVGEDIEVMYRRYLQFIDQRDD